MSFLSLEMVNPPYTVSASWFQSGELISIFDIPSGIQNINPVQFHNDHLYVPDTMLSMKESKMKACSLL